MLAVENQASCEKAEHTTIQDEEGGLASPMATDTSLGMFVMITSTYVSPLVGSNCTCL